MPGLGTGPLGQMPLGQGTSGFDYAANVAAVRQALIDHNTTGATPSLFCSVTAGTISTIRVDDPEVVAVGYGELPAIFIRIQAGDEEPASLGPTGPNPYNVRKFKTVVYEIVGLYHRDGMHSSHASHLEELYKFAQNVEAVFQDEFKLSGTALWCHPERTDFGTLATKEGDRVKAFITTLRARYLFR